MLERCLNITLHGPYGDAKVLSDLRIGQVPKQSRLKDLARTRRQSLKCSQQCIHFGARFSDLCRARILGSDIEDRVDVCCRSAQSLGPKAILAYVDSRAKEIVFGIFQDRLIGHPIKTRECFMQCLAGKIGRAETTRQSLDEAVVVGSEHRL